MGEMPKQDDIRSHYPPPLIDSEARQRIALLERETNGLVNRLESLEGTLKEIRTDFHANSKHMATVVNDVKWMKDALLPLVQRNRDATEQAAGSSNVSKALGIIAILTAIVGTLLGVSGVSL